MWLNICKPAKAVWQGGVYLTFMNNLLDKFPVNLPAMFTNRTGYFEEVYIISNLPLDKLYTIEQATAPEVYDAFRQRIQNIIHFTDFCQWHYEKKDGKVTSVKYLRPVDDGSLPF